MGLSPAYPAGFHHFPDLAVHAHGAHMERRRRLGLSVSSVPAGAHAQAYGASMTVRVNGVAVSEQDWPSPQMAAVHELLRQRALALGWLADGAGPEHAEQAIERVLAEEVRIP